jgi:hypothetical protein
MPPSKIKAELLTQYFEDRSEEVFDVADLEYLFTEKSHEWNLPPSMTPYSFTQMLLTTGRLEKLHLRSKHYTSRVLYSWQGTAAPFSIALSLRKEQSFFSHASAMWIHGLNEHHKQIFLNKEQSAKPTRPSSLSQESIDRAFQNQQRQSKMSYQFKGSTITLLNGKHTGRTLRAISLSFFADSFSSKPSSTGVSTSPTGYACAATIRLAMSQILRSTPQCASATENL